MPKSAPPPPRPRTAEELLELGRSFLASAPRRPAVRYDRFFPMLDELVSQGMRVQDIVRRLVEVGEITEAEAKNTREAFYRRVRNRQAAPERP